MEGESEATIIRERILELRETARAKYMRAKTVMDRVEEQFKGIFLHLSRIDQAHFYANKMIDLLDRQMSRQYKAIENQAKVREHDIAEFIECSQGKRKAVFEKLLSRISDHHDTLVHPIEVIESSVQNIGELEGTVKMVVDAFMKGEDHHNYRDAVMKDFHECGEITDNLVQMAKIDDDIEVLALTVLNENSQRNLRSNLRASSSSAILDMADTDDEDDDVFSKGLRSSFSSQKRKSGGPGEVVNLDDNSDSDFEATEVQNASSKKKRGSLGNAARIESSPYFKEQQQQQQAREVTSNEAHKSLDMIKSDVGKQVSIEVAATDRSMGNYHSSDEDEGTKVKQRAEESSGPRKRRRMGDADDEEWAGSSQSEEEAEMDFDQDQNRDNDNGKGRGRHNMQSKKASTGAVQAVDLT